MDGTPTASTGADPVAARHVLVTGADGFVGAATCAHLRERGHAVTGTSRHPPAGEPSIRLIDDIGPETSWDGWLERVDTVVHLAARVHVRDDRSADSLAAFRHVNVAGTTRLLEAAARAGVGTFVYVSSIGVLGERSDRAVDESAPPAPGTPYAVSKLEAERVVAAAAGGMRVAIVRPPMVYGPGAPGNFPRLVRAIGRRWYLPFGLVRNQRSFIFVHNLAHALVRVAEDARASGVYHVADERPLSTPEFVLLIADALGLPPRLVPVPVAALRAAAAVTGTRATLGKLVDSFPIDQSRIRAALGWTPPWTAPEAIRASVVAA